VTDPSIPDDGGPLADEEYDDEPSGQRGRDRDGVSALRDVEAEQGDEEYLDDSYDLDDREASSLGASLDDRDEPESRLD
jgi:hypothetical protein